MNAIDDKRMALAMEERTLMNRMQSFISEKRSLFVRHTAKLETLNPLAVVSRGYSAVFDESGTLIKSVSQTKAGNSISFMLTDGKVHASVTEIESNEHE